jgi:hypothetical protein
MRKKEGLIWQDLRKSHLNGRMLELLNQVVREHSMLNLVNSFACLVSDRLEASPNQQGTGNMIALNTRFAALTGFDSGQLL